MEPLPLDIACIQRLKVDQLEANIMRELDVLRKARVVLASDDSIETHIGPLTTEKAFVLGEPLGGMDCPGKNVLLRTEIILAPHHFHDVPNRLLLNQGAIGRELSPRPVTLDDSHQLQGESRTHKRLPSA